jgi:hypothetical protein
VVRVPEWLEAHPRIQHAFIPVGAAWLNLIEIEGWWRVFRRKAFAGQSLADDHDIAFVTRIATEHLNRHANPWVWGRPPKPHRVLRRRVVYYLFGTAHYPYLSCSESVGLFDSGVPR